MPDQMREDVINSFAPGEGTKDYNAKFMSFAKSRLERDGPGHQASRRADPVEDFIHKWSLDERASARLRELPWERQNMIMESFSPKPGTTHYSSMLMAFIKQRVGFQSAEADEISDFGRKWGLIDDAVKQLRDTPEKIQEHVMRTFSPGDAKDPNARFMNFLHSCNGRSRDKGSGKGGAKDSLKEPSRPWDSKDYKSDYKKDYKTDYKNDWKNDHDSGKSKWESKTSTSFSKGKDDWSSNGKDKWHSKDEVADFGKTWGLDEKCLSNLRQLSWEAQKDTMSSFAPMGGISAGHMNAKFMAFLRTKRSQSHDSDTQPWKKQRFN